MITNEKLGEALNAIFSSQAAALKNRGLGNVCIRPTKGNFWSQETDPDDKETNWISYTILDHRSRQNPENENRKAIVTRFRITVFGPQAEELIQTILFWNDNSDVQKAFGEMRAEIDQKAVLGGSAYLEYFKSDGKETIPVWVTDIEAITWIDPE